MGRLPYLPHARTLHNKAISVRYARRLPVLHGVVCKPSFPPFSPYEALPKPQDRPASFSNIRMVLQGMLAELKL